MSKSGGWIGVDFDGTLAKYDEWKGSEHTGEPIPAMVERVKTWLADGEEVRIFTARVSVEDCACRMGEPTLMHMRCIRRLLDARQSRLSIEAWCEQHIGRKLAITNRKDYGMTALYDDRCNQVIPNTGELAISAAVRPKRD